MWLVSTHSSPHVRLQFADDDDETVATLRSVFDERMRSVSDELGAQQQRVQEALDAMGRTSERLAGMEELLELKVGPDVARTLQEGLNQVIKRVNQLQQWIEDDRGARVHTEEAMLTKTAAAEATCRRLASDAIARAAAYGDKVLAAVAELEHRVAQQASANGDGAAPSAVQEVIEGFVAAEVAAMQDWVHAQVEAVWREVNQREDHSAPGPRALSPREERGGRRHSSRSPRGPLKGSPRSRRSSPRSPRGASRSPRGASRSPRSSGRHTKSNRRLSPRSTSSPRASSLRASSPASHRSPRSARRRSPRSSTHPPAMSSPSRSVPPRSTGAGAGAGGSSSWQAATHQRSSSSPPGRSAVAVAAAGTGGGSSSSSSSPPGQPEYFTDRVLSSAAPPSVTVPPLRSPLFDDSMASKDAGAGITVGGASDAADWNGHAAQPVSLGAQSATQSVTDDLEDLATSPEASPTASSRKRLPGRRRRSKGRGRASPSRASSRAGGTRRGRKQDVVVMNKQEYKTLMSNRGLHCAGEDRHPPVPVQNPRRLWSRGTSSFASASSSALSRPRRTRNRRSSTR